MNGDDRAPVTGRELHAALNVFLCLAEPGRESDDDVHALVEEHMASMPSERLVAALSVMGAAMLVNAGSQRMHNGGLDPAQATVDQRVAALHDVTAALRNYCDRYDEVTLLLDLLDDLEWPDNDPVG